MYTHEYIDEISEILSTEFEPGVLQQSAGSLPLRHGRMHQALYTFVRGAVVNLPADCHGIPDSIPVDEISQLNLRHESNKVY